MLERFPPEIVRKIANNFNRHDFLECVQVNRSWRQHLPPYSSHLWKHVDIKTHGHLVFLAQTSCFGQYIDSCNIVKGDNDALLHHALKRLQGCHLQSLVIDWFKIEDNKRLADLLKNVRCESLKFNGISGVCLDFIGIIMAASEGDCLRHFGCHYDAMYPILAFAENADMCPYPPPPPPLPIAQDLGLVSLALTTQNLQADWMDILQRCSTTLQHIHIAVADPISCHDIMSTCPQLQSMFIGEFAVPKTVEFPPSSSSDKQGLRYFGHWGACDDINAMKFVLEHQHTIEYLYLSTWVPVKVPSWSDLDSFQSTSLKTLVCAQMHECTPDTIASLIRQSPNLETVALYPVDHHSITDKIWHALMNLDTLQHLSIHLEIWQYGDDRDQQWRALIRRLGTITTLRKLELTALDGANSDHLSQLFQVFHDMPLEKLRLLSIRELDDKALEALIPHAPLMEILDIVDCPIVTTRGIKTLIDGLPKLRNATFSLARAQRMPAGVDDLISFAKSKGIKLVLNRLL
ncbi:hypothetical protein O0I10_003537 [Lichtheimia ornata]|uniref:F-box domain-containing protein n=1 Tax=Lichtheimia ornata TaxID=688661 RepID=A0AAD7Y1D0_9FUNG|nr:uncharacterized protein O0I10_003537 [Lichtheimia ornata]KAJ8660893.1 hypothetical protein O0I10_003537 [Lichtheimia ornata]